MKTRNSLLIIVLIAGSVISGCSPRSRYDRMLKRELESGVRNDSLFMGLYLGMPEKAFYTKCWQLNQKGLIRQGPTNTTVQYEIKKDLKYPVVANFYPRFMHGDIYEMPVRYVYKGWAPWNKKLSADKLESDILRWYEHLYGKGFIKVVHPKWGAAYVKVTGNRRITIFKENEMYVWAVFTDLFASNTPLNQAADTTSTNNNSGKTE